MLNIGVTVPDALLETERRPKTERVVVVVFRSANIVVLIEKELFDSSCCLTAELFVRAKRWRRVLCDWGGKRKDSRFDQVPPLDMTRVFSVLKKRSIKIE